MRLRWGVTLVLSCTGAVALAEPCPAIVIVEATPALRDSITTQLTARAILTIEQVGCTNIRVHLRVDDTGIAIAITDAVGRTDQRHVPDLATAASLIESWARPELDATLLAVRTVRQPRLPSTARIAPIETETPVVLEAPATSIAVRGPPIRVAVDAGSSLGSDGSVWLDLSGLVCVRFGPVCPGVMARVSQDTEVRGDSEVLSTRRHAIDLGVVLDVPRMHAGWSWTPGVQFGLGFNRRTFAPEIGIAMDRVETDGGSLRAGVHLAVAKQVARRWSLGIDVALDTAVVSPADLPDREADRLASQPRNFVRSGIELRYEGL